MKYNKTLKQLMSTDERFMELGAHTLSYDAWKKRIKNPTTHFRNNWHLYLANECAAIDDRIFSPRLFEVCCCMGQALTPEEKLLVSDLNKQTLYKICKRIDKKLLPTPTCAPSCTNACARTQTATQWRQQAIATHAFRFLGCPELARTRLATQTAPSECPVCLENLDPGTATVLPKCFHAMCPDCSPRCKRCPVCRAPM